MHRESTGGGESSVQPGRQVWSLSGQCSESLDSNHSVIDNTIQFGADLERQSTPGQGLPPRHPMTPAVPLLDYRQTRYAQRLLQRPKGSSGAEVILNKAGSALAERLRKTTFVRNDLVTAFLEDGGGRRGGGKLPGTANGLPGRIIPDCTESETLATRSRG